MPSKVELLIVNVPWKFSIAPPAWAAVLLVKAEFVIVPLPPELYWIAPPMIAELLSKVVLAISVFTCEDTAPPLPLWWYVSSTFVPVLTLFENAEFVMVKWLLPPVPRETAPAWFEVLSEKVELLTVKYTEFPELESRLLAQPPIAEASPEAVPFVKVELFTSPLAVLSVPSAYI